MPKETGLYTLLGVSPDADESQLKKAYRKLALKYHPDKPTGDETKFKEVGEAYDILSNKDKRALYDQHGLEAARSGQAPMPDFGGAQNGGFDGSNFNFGGSPGGGGFSSGGFPGGSFKFSSNGGGGGGFSSADAFNIFEAMGLGGMGGGMGGSTRRSGNPFGVSAGAGGHPFGGGASMYGDSEEDYGYGSGSGFGGPKRSHTAVKPEPLLVPLKVSLEDLYNGVTKKLKIGRKTASGEKEYNILEVNVKKGWKSGTKVTYPNKGDFHDGVYQDVVFEIVEQPNDKFKREGNDLKTSVKLDFKESLTGFERIIETIDGKKIRLSKASPVQPASTAKYPGRGMPISKSPGSFGDLIVQYDVSYPTVLNDAQKAAINTNF